MNEFEKEFDDEVYEDSFYGEEEELVDEEEKELKDSGSDSDSDEVEVVKVDVSFACDDCDYRWDDVIVRRKDEYDDDSDGVICPMCGSMNVTQI